MSQDIQALIGKLEKIMGNAPRGWSYVYWIETEEDFSSENYCKDCAEIKLKEYLDGRLEDLKDDDAVIRASIGYDSDGPCNCELCCAPLVHILTDYGCRTEIKSYADFIASDQEQHEVTPELAYSLEMLLQYIENNQPASAEEIAETTMERLLFVNMVERLLDPNVQKLTFAQKRTVRI